MKEMCSEGEFPEFRNSGIQKTIYSWTQELETQKLKLLGKGKGKYWLSHEDQQTAIRMAKVL